MIKTTAIAPGVTLRYVRDTRFKQGCFSFQLVRPMRKEEAAKNALLPAVLLRGTRNCPDLRAVTQRLDELYGAAVSPSGVMDATSSISPSLGMPKESPAHMVRSSR